MVGKLLRCKRAFAAGLCAAFLLFMSACQENPEGSIVVHKDMDNLISQAQKEGPDKTDAARLAEEIREQFEPYRVHLEDESLNVTVNVNATVDLPETDKLGVYRVKQKKFDQEFVDRVRSALMGGKTVYETRALFQETKADLEESIKTYRDLLRQTEEELAGGGNQTYNGPPLTQEEWEEHYREAIERFQEELDMLQERYESAPAEADPTRYTRYPSEGKLHTNRELAELLPDLYGLYNEGEAEDETLSLIADASDGNYQTLSVQNSAERGNALYYCAGPGHYFDPMIGAFQPLDPAAYDDIAPGNGSIPPNFLSVGVAITGDDVLTPLEDDTATLTEEEALRRAKEFLSEIGLSDFACCEGGKFNEIAQSLSETSKEEHTLYYRPYYILRFRREIGGVLLNQASGEKRAYSGDGDSYRAQYWPGEQIELRINDAGIAGFAYMAPIEVTEIVVENAALKAFRDIADTFEKMACMLGDPEDRQLALSADIDRVRLSYSRISERDNFDSGLIVPVWSFEGTTRIRFREETWPEVPANLLSINAIDGSIIDGELGY